MTEILVYRKHSTKLFLEVRDNQRIATCSCPVHLCNQNIEIYIFAEIEVSSRCFLSKTYDIPYESFKRHQTYH